jgi:hypothetical protein
MDASKKTYSPPALRVYGSVEDLTGTGWGDCWFPRYDKTIGFPSDTNFKFIPIEDCASGIS